MLKSKSVNRQLKILNGGWRDMKTNVIGVAKQGMLRVGVLGLTLLASVFAFLSSSASAQQTADLEFTFTQPNSRTDGSSLDASELDRAVLSVQGGGVLAEIPASAPSITTITNFAVAGGECFELVTYDTQGLFSDPAIACLKARPGKAQTINIRVNFTGN